MRVFVAALVVVLLCWEASFVAAGRTRNSIPIRQTIEGEIQQSLLRRIAEDVGLASVQAVVTADGVATLQHAVTPQLANNLVDSIQIPPIAGEEDIDIYLLKVRINYNVSNIRITDITFTNDTIAIVPGVGVLLSVNNAGAKISADFSYSIPNPLVNIHGTGVADIGVGQINLQMVMNMTADQQGYPVIGCPKASLVLGSFSTKITLHSKVVQAIVDFFAWLFNGIIKSKVQSAITAAIYDNLNVGINQKIHEQSLQISLPPNASRALLDVSLPSPPVVMPSYILVPAKGEVFLAPGLHSNFSPSAIPALPTGQMLQLSVGLYTLNTAGWAYYKSGLLSYLITNADLPSWLPMKLNTASFSLILPVLYKLYPNWDMNIDFEVSHPITFMIDPSGSKEEGVTVNMVGDMVVNVISPNGTWVSVFDLETTLKLKFDINFNGTEALYGKLGLASFNTVLKSSQIGSFDVSVINVFLNLLFGSVLVPQANSFLHNTPLFQFPTIAGFRYANPALVYSTDFMTLSADFIVTSPSLFSHAIGL